MQKANNNIEIRVFKAQELRAEPDSRTLRGYAAVYDSDSEDLGGFTERIAPGAFDEVLEDDVRALVNHEDSKILARTVAGTLRLSTDSRGLVYEFDVPDTTYGNDLLESVRRGDINQSSFGFVVGEEQWEGESSGYKDKKKPRRTITKVARLFDVSPVTYPAYPDTSVALRSLKEKQENSTNELQQQIDTEQAHLVRALIIHENINKL